MFIIINNIFLNDFQDKVIYFSKFNDLDSYIIKKGFQIKSINKSKLDHAKARPFIFQLYWYCTFGASESPEYNLFIQTFLVQLKITDESLSFLALKLVYIL